MKQRKTIIIVALMLLLIGGVLVTIIPKYDRMAQIGVGYQTKIMCSEVFVAGRAPEDVAATNFQNIDPLMDYVSLDVDPVAQTVTGSLLGLGKSKTIYRDKLGCTVDIGNGVFDIDIKDQGEINADNTHTYTVALKPEVQAAVAELFDDNELAHPIVTRGVVVVQNGEIVAEHYSDGFDKDTRQQSWSMAKGVTQALVGILVDRKVMSLDDKNLMANWPESDPRADISLGQLLHMASGLEFAEEYGDAESDATQMLFNSSDMGVYAAEKPLAVEPGSKSQYSSGTTNIVSLVMRNKLEASGENYHDFPYDSLFTKIGMNSAIFEVDASGTFIGSSYIYATPRDFARFGQLYLQNGMWDDEQILPERWVDYTGQPAPGSDGKYGSHWSINRSGKNLPGMPNEVIYLGGNDGQFIFVIPSKNAVIVRLGVMREPATFENELYPLIRSVFDKL
ncbi:MAG: serine hydrolase [Parasphingorhabdus sp.]|uniref:serine hydrolase domain-containing protein n=1 Tax=Parasphingorhabdus sp. TaxID=2709688 RepID=UPI00329A423C